jgi:hypothetical protein
MKVFTDSEAQQHWPQLLDLAQRRRLRSAAWMALCSR